MRCILQPTRRTEHMPAELMHHFRPYSSKVNNTSFYRTKSLVAEYREAESDDFPHRAQYPLNMAVMHDDRRRIRGVVLVSDSSRMTTYVSFLLQGRGFVQNPLKKIRRDDALKAGATG